MTDVELLRTMLSDAFKNGSDEILLDEETKLYELTHHPLKVDTLVLQVNNTEQTEGTDFTLELATGLITFTDAPTSGQLMEATYKYSVFSDEELSEFISLDGSVDAAMVRCLEVLLMDSARRFDYSSGITNMKPSQVFSHLKDLLNYYQGKVGSGKSSPQILSRTNRHYQRHNRDYFLGAERKSGWGRDISREDE